MILEQLHSLDAIWRAVPSPNSKLILTSPTDRGLTLYSANAFEEITEVDIRGRCTCFSPNSEKFAFKYLRKIYIYDIFLDEVCTEISVKRWNVGDFEMCFSADSSKLINLYYTDEMFSYISVYDVETGEELNRFFEGDGCVFNDIWYSQSEKRYLVSGYKRTPLLGGNEYMRFWLDLDGKFDMVYRSHKYKPLVNFESCFVYEENASKLLTADEAENFCEELKKLLPSKQATSFYVFDSFTKLLAVIDEKLTVYAIR